MLDKQTGGAHFRKRAGFYYFSAFGSFQTSDRIDTALKLVSSVDFRDFRLKAT